MVDVELVIDVGKDEVACVLLTVLKDKDVERVDKVLTDAVPELIIVLVISVLGLEAEIEIETGVAVAKGEGTGLEVDVNVDEKDDEAMRRAPSTPLITAAPTRNFI